MLSVGTGEELRNKREIKPEPHLFGRKSKIIKNQHRTNVFFDTKKFIVPFETINFFVSKVKRKS